MNERERLLARKYVKAYIKVYGDSWKVEQILYLDKLISVFEGRRGPLYYVQLECIPEARKRELLLQAVASMGLSLQLDDIIIFLHKHRQLSFLNEVAKLIREALYKQYAIEDITIFSASPLSESDRKRIEQWIARSRHLTEVRSSVVLDRSLIAGFRVEGIGFMADYSINQQLRTISRICAKGLSWK